MNSMYEKWLVFTLPSSVIFIIVWDDVSLRERKHLFQVTLTNTALYTHRSEKAMAPHSSTLAWKIHGRRSLIGCSPWGRWGSDTTERLHFHFSHHALEKEMATHSSVLAWRIPGMGEAGGLPSMGSHRVGHEWSDLAAAATLYCGNNNAINPRRLNSCLINS